MVGMYLATVYLHKLRGESMGKGAKITNEPIAVGFLITTYEPKNRTFGVTLEMAQHQWRQTGTPVLSTDSGTYKSGPMFISCFRGTRDIVLRFDGLSILSVAEGATGSCLIPELGFSGRWECIIVTR